MGNDLAWRAYQEQIQKLSVLDYNYDEKVYHDSVDKKDWFIDSYQAILAVEPSGEPLPTGPFMKAKESLTRYQFTDPKLITAVYDPDQPLIGRNMLMFGHFANFTFTFGVRVTAVVDEIQTNDQGQRVNVWGYSYRTLKGHFEIGQIHFQINKNQSTGEVTFNIDAYSKPDRIPNWFFRTGFKIFGRRLQKYFAKSSIERLQRLAKKSLAVNESIGNP